MNKSIIQPEIKAIRKGIIFQYLSLNFIIYLELMLLILQLTIKHNKALHDPRYFDDFGIN